MRNSWAGEKFGRLAIKSTCHKSRLGGTAPYFEDDMNNLDLVDTTQDLITAVTCLFVLHIYSAGHEAGWGGFPKKTYLGY